MNHISSRLAQFVRHESFAGGILILFALLALAIDNSRLAWAYGVFLETPVSVRIGALAIDKPLLLWINDGLMAVFFLLVGLEIKREMIEGELSGLSRAALPAIAAFGGMAVPALVYVAVNFGNPAAMRGWAIASATDIAFAMAILALLGSRISPALKAFLLALAIIDDLGSIVIIALFYTADLSMTSLVLAAVCAGALLALNRARVQRLAPYMIVGAVMWVCVLKSGVHATLAGVATAIAVPMHGSQEAREDHASGPLHTLVEALHPWVAYAILPLFAFANAGVSLAGLPLSRLLEPIPLGIALGLFVGKQVGVFAFAAVAIRLGLGQLPDGAGWRELYGVSLLAGIGFTMSLFIGTLAFPGGGEAASVRIGVIAGSLVSALLGYLVLLGTPMAAEAHSERR